MEIKSGDKVFVKNWFGGFYTATILKTSYGIFGKRYLAKWKVTNIDYGLKYEKIGFIYWYKIIK